jgi:hypothetical protein
MAHHSRSLKHIAQALSLAQRELENPPARHDGQIRRPLSTGASLLEPYRYASLGDGLALIRPILGRHGLSVIQSTQSDAGLGLLILQTRLIHQSGEWISSDYPVTRLDGLNPDDPRQTGAALTYARRQSLFALVGIAGQADTDGVSTLTSGPPPAAPIQGVAVSPSPDTPVSGAARASAADRAEATMRSAPFMRDARRRAGVPKIAADRSTELAQRLTADLALLSSDEDKRQWAIRNVSAMRELMPEDRASLNRLFAAAINPRVEELPSGASAASASVASAAQQAHEAAAIHR